MAAACVSFGRTTDTWGRNPSISRYLNSPVNRPSFCRPRFHPSTNAGEKFAKSITSSICPSFEAVESLNTKLAKVGNLASDGRPILGLDSRVLMEMVLDTHPQAFVIPAHIWTPWFSLFGSKSGFDTLERMLRRFFQRNFCVGNRPLVRSGYEPHAVGIG